MELLRKYVEDDIVVTVGVTISNFTAVVTQALCVCVTRAYYCNF